jgi:ABC-2 type transport system ATP-binding protein
MQQRINLCRTLVHDPGLLLLDEPAAGLDPQARRDVRELLRLLADEEKTVLISSHILSELEGLVDNVIIINEGKLVYSGHPGGREGDGEDELSLNLRVVGDLQRSTRLLLEVPGVARVTPRDPDGLRVVMSGGRDEIAEVVRTLVTDGQVPYMIMTEERMLERVFLDATRPQDDGGRA